LQFAIFIFQFSIFNGLLLCKVESAEANANPAAY
jgi:hypothetical protein